MNQSGLLHKKRILITGASSGIGRQIAISIAEVGGFCVLTGRNKQRLEQTVEKISGEGHIAVSADLTVTSELEKLVDETPSLDGIVYSAGVTNHLPAKFIDGKQIDQIMGINFKAAVLLIRSLLAKKKMKNGASIVFLSSIATKHPYYGGALYIASKRALEGFSSTLALELSSRDIRSNCLSPAMVQTEMLDETEKMISSETLDKFKNLHPLGLGKPENVADVALYLLSGKASWITGQNIVIGGF